MAADRTNYSSVHLVPEALGSGLMCSQRDPLGSVGHSVARGVLCFGSQLSLGPGAVVGTMCVLRAATATATLPSGGEGGLKVRGGKSSQPWSPVSLWCALMHSSSNLSFSEEKMRPGGRFCCHPATPVTFQWPSLSSSSSSAFVAFVTTNCTPSTAPFSRGLLLILCPQFL